MALSQERVGSGMRSRVPHAGIVLAAGEGARLRRLVFRLTGEEIPKQYVRFDGKSSPLEQALRRAEMLIPPERLYTIVSERHLEHRDARAQLSGRYPGTVVRQPSNRDTGPGLLLALAHLQRCHPDAVVAVFPSDHRVVEENRFMDHVGRACQLVERDPEKLVLLGVTPHEAEPEYGYIIPRASDGASGGEECLAVARFVERPPAEMAGGLIRGGALWNTLVMIFQARAFLELARGLAPGLCQTFDLIASAIGKPGETQTTAEAYRDIPSLNLSRDILEVLPGLTPSRLLVLPVRGVRWSDWGSEDRLLRELGTLSAAEPSVAGTGAERAPEHPHSFAA
jgi:mannose-1-phosphate guanylyltransferase/mannose-6-phosphate isomerase